MNSFLLIVILAICGGAYYEYNVLDHAKKVEDQQMADMQTRLNLQNDLIRELTATGTAASSPKVADLMSQLSKLNAAAATTGTTATTPSSGAPGQPSATTSAPATEVASQPMPAPTPAPAPTVSANDLGTIVTIDARTFQNCHLLKVQNDGITFKHTAGITKVLFPLLPPDVQKRFGFDPHQPLLSDDEVLRQEDMRRAAGTRVPA